MELKSNQYVVFRDVDGTEFREGYLEARWSDAFGKFYSFTRTGERDDNGRPVRLFSEDVVSKESKPRKQSKQAMVEIQVAFETEKAFAYEAGGNGCVSKGNRREFYEFVAKSLCEVRDGKIYAPAWAVK